MSEQFQRERRYVVFKVKDLVHLTPDGQSNLTKLCGEIHSIRHHRGKLDEIKCVVVESDWPEYEVVWAMIKARMENAPIAWLPPETAPKDGSMLRLQVRFDEHSTEDDDVGATIGFNSLDHTGEDHWEIAGWNWTHDRFTAGTGEVIGWLPMVNSSQDVAPISVNETASKE